MKSFFLKLTSLTFIILVWEKLTTNSISMYGVSFENIPSASNVFLKFLNLFNEFAIFEHIYYSILRVSAGFSIALVAGVSLGFIIHSSKIFNDTIKFPLEILRPIPGVAWIPISILLFTSSEVSIIFIIVIGAIYPILLNTIHGANSVNLKIIEAAKSLGANKFDIYLRIIIPLSLPSVITGASIGMGTSWFCLITSEMISGKFGVGYFVWESYILQEYENVIIGMILIGVLGALNCSLINIIGRKFTPWITVSRA